MKNITIISTKKESKFLFPIFSAINKKNKLKLLSSDKELIRLFKENNLKTQKIRKFFSFHIFGATSIFILFWPFIFFFLFYLKVFKKTDILIFISKEEKYLLSFFASILKIKVIWFEFPEDWINNKRLSKKKHRKIKIIKHSKIFKIFFLFLSRKVIFSIFDELTKGKLQEIGIKKENIFLIRPGIIWPEHIQQKNIFSKLAEISQKKSRRQKFFTIGTVLDENNGQNVKTILQAAKDCLLKIPNLQLIIIGKGKDKKNLSWLARQIGINNAVWFVGEKSHLQKWLENISVFIISNSDYSLKNIQIAIEVLSAGIPIIASNEIGWEEIVQSNKNGYLTNINNKKFLSETIIKIEQNPILIKKMGQVSRNLAKEKFSLEKNIIPLLNLLKS